MRLRQVNEFAPGHEADKRWTGVWILPSDSQVLAFHFSTYVYQGKEPPLALGQECRQQACLCVLLLPHGLWAVMALASVLSQKEAETPFQRTGLEWHSGISRELDETQEGWRPWSHQGI